MSTGIQALYCNSLADGTAECVLCPHRCHIPSGKSGRCGVRTNRDGILWADSYGTITSAALDPIEKKPLRRFFPGSTILSLGSWGCNLSCPFCQNHQIASGRAEGDEKSPEWVASISLALAEEGNIGVAYTYNEPLVGYEFVLDCAKHIHRQGQKNVLVTNGFIEEEPFAELLPYIDALNIDLKTFDPSYYRTLGGDLEPVQRTIRAAARCSHLEVTTLVVPKCNDSLEEMEALAGWLGQVDEEIPLHITRFFPRHQMTDCTATPVSRILELTDVARKYLKWVYLGNI